MIGVRCSKGLNGKKGDDDARLISHLMLLTSHLLSPPNTHVGVGGVLSQAHLSDRGKCIHVAVPLVENYGIH